MPEEPESCAPPAAAAHVANEPFDHRAPPRGGGSLAQFGQSGDVSGDMWATTAIQGIMRCLSLAPLEFMPRPAWITIVERRVYCSKLEQVLEWQARVEAERAESMTPTSTSGQHGPDPRRKRAPK